MQKICESLRPGIAIRGAWKAHSTYPYEVIMDGILFKIILKSEKRAEFIEYTKWDADIARKWEPGTISLDVY